MDDHIYFEDSWNTEKKKDYVGKRAEYMKRTKERLVELLINKEELLEDDEKTINILHQDIDILTEQLLFIKG